MFGMFTWACGACDWADEEVECENRRKADLIQATINDEWISTPVYSNLNDPPKMNRSIKDLGWLIMNGHTVADNDIIALVRIIQE